MFFLTTSNMAAASQLKGDCSFFENALNFPIGANER
jgi:hypothetical protein